MLNNKISKKFILAVMMLFIFAANGAFAAEVILTAPGRVEVGKPFTVMVSVEDPPEGGVLFWRETKVPLDFRKEADRYVALAMLGTEADETGGASFSLEAEITARGQKRELSREVMLVTVEYPEQHLSLSENMVTPPKDVLDRINREAAMVKEALAGSSPERMWEVPFHPPLKGAVTSPYGTKRTMNKTAKGFHKGVDLRAVLGTPVAAPSRGVVALADDLYFAGKCVYIDHGNGVFSVMMHLSEISVKAGDKVEPGDLVGKTGQTGRVTGPHLHFGVRVQGKWVNPLPLFEEGLS